MPQIRIYTLALLTSLLVGFVLSSCGRDCSDVLVPSTLITVVDDDDHVITDPRLVVEFQLPSWDHWEPCSDFGSSSAPAIWRCGEELEGTLNIRASLGDMSGRTDGIRVKADRCHVKTRDVELLLQ